MPIEPIKKRKQIFWYKPETTWSDLEMEKFDKELDNYRIEFIPKENNKKPFRFFSLGGELKFLEDQKVIKVKWLKPWQEVQGTTDALWGVIEDMEQKYLELETKLDFLQEWKESQKLGDFGL